VQQALLKIIEGTEVRVSLQSNRKHPNAEMLTVNTKNILFIVGGAFVGLEKLVSERLDKDSVGIGFGAKMAADKSKIPLGTLLTMVEPEDLTKYGLIPELVGRLPVTVSLEELDEEQLIRVLTEPKNAIIKQFTKMFKLEHIELEFDSEALTHVARQAITRKTGARGLRSVIEKKLIPVQFHLPEYREDGVKKILVGKDVIAGTSLPKMIKEDGEVAKPKIAN
jgi:ATP-dependent Clp protease ATP-binding subunit ClpX